MDEDAQRRIMETLADSGVVENIVLSGFDFDRLDTDEQYSFLDCTLEQCVIQGGSLGGSSWKDCRILKCKFASCNLREVVFKNCKLFDPESMEGSQFRFCDLSFARFESCELAVSNFYGCEAHGIGFEQSRMSGVVIEQTSFAREVGNVKDNSAKFNYCNIRGGIVRQMDFSNCTITSCDLSDADMSESNLKDAEVTDSELFNTDFTGADLSRADFRRSTLGGFDLSRVQRYDGMKISAAQQHILLNSIGIDVDPE